MRVPPGAPGAHVPPPPDTTPAAADQLLAAHPGAVLVIEPHSNAGWGHDRAVAAGHTVKLVNTAGEAWKFTRLKRKTDYDDTKRLAELEANSPRSPWRTRAPGSGAC